MHNSKKILLTLVLAGALTLGAIGIVHAQTNSVTNTASTTPATTTSTTVSPPTQTDPSKGGHVGANGVTEVLLTGDTATKVKAASLAAVPGGTVLRVENDAEGATYEAHMTKSDGSQVTVFFDSNFNLTGTESGMGPASHPGSTI
jgi:hypothetical protein